MEPRHPPILAMIPPPACTPPYFLAGVGLDRLMPWRPTWLTMQGVHWAGAALAFAGFIVAPVSAGWFVRLRTTLNPAGQPAHLVVEGADAWSRNPMYLSLTIVHAGVALALGEAWPLVLVVLPWAAMNWVVVPFEEARLREAFGQDYAGYCRRVRRWI
jgi:protein-S-isoprenylcysteine O-methyltransferase Ste14